MSTTQDWTEYYPDSIRPDLTPDHPTLPAAWEANVRSRSTAPAVHYFDSSLTFGHLDRAADALACALLAVGLGRGDRVGVYLQNDPQWLVTLLATWRIGGTAVALNPMLKGDDLAHHLVDSGVRVLVCLESLHETARPVLARTSVETVITTHPLDLTPHATVPEAIARHIPVKEIPDGAVDLAELLVRYEGHRPPRIGVAPEDLAMLTYTSGTTGRAKGAMNLHGAMAYSSTVYTHWWDLQAEQDVIICVAPVFHITGSITGLGAHMVSGAPLVLMHRFDSETTLTTIAARRGTFMVAASTVYIALADHPTLDRDAVSSLTKTLSGGAPVSQALVDRIADAAGWRIRGAYGMTETNSPTHLGPVDHDPPADPVSGALAVGVPVPGATYRIVDPDTGRDLPPGQSGEIVVCGPMVIPGYWQLPDETAHAIRDGWLHTGDVGKVTEDGWLFVVDRIKDIINAGGYKVYPRDVEDVLQSHPAVREVAVVGVPDEYRGETVKAYVSLSANETVTAEELIDFCKDRMSAYKYPRIIEIRGELPKNASGKLLRRDLRSALTSVTGKDEQR